jgi:hypothetical protein
MPSSGSGISWNATIMAARLRTLDPRIQRALAATLKYSEPRAVAWARKNAPWRDRTTNARNGLFAKADISGRTYRLTVGHGVPYGIWLEVRFSGRYAIIMPTVRNQGPQVMQTARRLIARELARG